jgi:hypothetical protein
VRKLLLVVASVLVCGAAFGMNWRSDTRATHKSLDCIVRRLERVLPTLPEDSAEWRDVKASLNHLKPILERFGGAAGWAQIELGSEDELDLICAQYGFAEQAANRESIEEEIQEGVSRWLWGKIKGFLLSCIPWTPIALWLWFKRKKILALFQARDAEVVAYDRAIEKAITDKAERRAKFTDPLVVSAHSRIKMNGNGGAKVVV